MGSIIPYKDSERFIKTIKSQTTLDIFSKENSVHPDIIKIDVEGAEISVLKGALDTINKYKPKIFLSTHPHHYTIMGIDSSELLKTINDINYTIKTISGKIVDKISLDEYILEPK